MISNQIMQNTIEGIKAIARVELFVADIDGKLVHLPSQQETALKVQFWSS